MISENYGDIKKCKPPTLENIELQSKLNTLLKKVECLETEVRRLKSLTKPRKTKSDTLEYLNNCDSGLTPLFGMDEFTTMLSDASCVHREIQFKENKILDIVKTLIQRKVEEGRQKYAEQDSSVYNNALPLISYEYHKNAAFYFEEKTQKWSLVSNELFVKLLRIIHLAIIRECSRWKSEHSRVTDTIMSEVDSTVHNRLTKEKEAEYETMIQRLCNVNITSSSNLAKIKTMIYEELSEEDSG